MAKQASASPTVISLPQGGGALRGIGETFAPDLHTGTGNFTVPIAVPSGRNGFQPSLNLVYSTGNGNGPFGLGWGLSVPGVSRKTSKGVPRYDDRDVFLLSGAEDLVPVARDGTITRYQPRTEGLFARIRHFQGNGDDYWEICSKDGLTSVYGTPGMAGEDPAAIIDLDIHDHIFAWRLTETRDPFGNRIEYSYLSDAGDTEGHRWNQPLLHQIRYVDYEQDGEQRFLVSITFDYESRPDPFSDYRSSFEIRTSLRCCSITIATHAGLERVQRIYHLVYLDQRQLEGFVLPHNGVSLLSQIWIEGRDEASPNLLANGSFSEAGPLGPATSQAVGLGGGDSAAARWTTWRNRPSTLSTRLESPAFSPGGEGTIYVATEGIWGGLVQLFGNPGSGPSTTTVSAWIFVRSGRVGIGAGDGGNTSIDAVTQTTGTWEYLSVAGHAPANEFAIYAASEGGAEFYVASASVSVTPRSEWLPPLEFGYTLFAPDERRFAPVTGADLPARSLANANMELVDLFGNGLPDILEMNGTVRYWRNLGVGRFDLPCSMRDAPVGLVLADSGVQLIDADGDGRTDLLTSHSGMSGYFPLAFDGRWDRRSFQRFQIAPSFNLEDPEVKLVDLDGDGLTDVLRSGTRFECFFNQHGRGWTAERTRWVQRQAIDVFPNVTFSDPRIKWGDLNGDGLQDIILIYDGNVEYWPNLGHGDWGSRIRMRHSPRFPRGYDPKRILVGDVDGDGLADVVYVDNGKVWLWINQSGNGWSEQPTVIIGTPPVSDTDAVRLVDLFGAGISGLLWSADADRSSRAHLFFLDFTGGIKPYLLHEMDNHIGATTRIAYAPSTRFYLADQQDAQTRWKTPLPFPVQVVAHVEMIDNISKGRLTTEYRYHHGYWDGAEREFRGFGMVEQLDTETFEAYAERQTGSSDFLPVKQRHFAPPTLTKTWFHQGPVGEEFGEWQELDRSGEYWAGDPPLLKHTESVNDFLKELPSRRLRRDALRTLRGSMLRTELYALDGSLYADRPYTVSEYAYGLREEIAPAPNQAERQRIFFPHRLCQRITQWERGDDPMTQFSFTDAYDAFGQPRQQTATAMPRRKIRRLPVTGAVVGTISGDSINESRILATHTRTEYALPESGLLIHDRAAQLRVFELSVPPGITESDEEDLPRILVEQRGAAEALHQRFRELIGSWSPGAVLPDDLKLISHTLHHYDGAGFVGRAAGEVGPYGSLTRSETLIFTDTELDKAYTDRRPIYLGGSAAPPAGTPAAFGSNLGYRREQDSGAGYHQGYYANTKCQQYDFQVVDPPEPIPLRGMVVAVQDVLGHQVDITLDRYWLLPLATSDPVQLKTLAECDYRVMQLTNMIDPNGNAKRCTFTPLGLLHKLILEGRQGEGGTDNKPEVEYRYDYFAYDRTRRQAQPQPLFVHTKQRICHANDSNPCDDLIEAREYSDGFGRLIQKRAQAEELVFGETGDDVGLAPQAGIQPDAAVGKRVTDAVIVSGWQVYDNKGRVIEKYEPAFAAGWGYQPEAKKGAHATLYYDPRGQLVRTVNPDGSEQRVIFGVPRDLGDPEDRVPTAWESYTYDSNDLASLSQRPDGTALASAAPLAHHYTPASAVLDALGRAICQVARNGPTPAGDWFVTRAQYDIRGNLLVALDALGRPAFQHVYDLLNRPLRVVSIDAGVRTSVLDAAGNLVEYRDSKGSIVLHEYDALNRLTRLWACDNDDPNSPFALRQQVEYGDGGDPQQPTTVRAANQALNRLGKSSLHRDEAGLQRFDRYDFKGNLIEKTRQVISDVALARGWSADWSAANSDSALGGTLYQTNTSFDALNRVTKLVYPEDVASTPPHRAVLTPHYNRAGLLEQVTLDGMTPVAYIAYNAKGQRVLVAYGNGVLTRFVYDRQTFRLARLRSERLVSPPPGPDRWAGRGDPLQDLTYAYDLAGNVASIEERTPGCGIDGSLHGRDRLVRIFQYDPLYRLTQADGRACKNPSGAPLRTGERATGGDYSDPYNPGAPAPDQENAPFLTERYIETYEYDPAGNMLTQRYSAPTDSWTRAFGLGDLPPAQWQQAPNNRLTSLEQGSQTPRYVYDLNGNMVRQNTERHYNWDHADRMIAFTCQACGSNNASVEARYLYDADGMRVKKWVRTGGAGNGESTVYIGELFEHHIWSENGTLQQHNILQVMDGHQRLLLVRRGQAHPKDAGPPIQYHLGDHLGSSGVVLDHRGDWSNREEYFPYGETSFGSFARKRYRYTGKERDEESGLAYHGARYYAPWLARWVSCDPAGMVDGVDLYIYTKNNPVGFVDPYGKETGKEQVEQLIAQRKQVVEDQATHQVGQSTNRPRERYLVNQFGATAKPGQTQMSEFQWRAPLSDFDRAWEEAKLVMLGVATTASMAFEITDYLFPHYAFIEGIPALESRATGLSFEELGSASLLDKGPNWLTKESAARALESRAARLQLNLAKLEGKTGEIYAKQTTIGVFLGKDAQGSYKTFVAGGGLEIPDATSTAKVAQALELDAEEVPVRMSHIRPGLEGVKKLDAEEKLTIYLYQENMTPIAGGTSRDVCSWCNFHVTSAPDTGSVGSNGRQIIFQGPR